MRKYQLLCTLPYLTLFGAFEGFALVSGVDLPKKSRGLANKKDMIWTEQIRNTGFFSV